MSKNFMPAFMDRKITNRVRQPPGGNTHDIFDLEKRQRNLIVYEDKKLGHEKTNDQEAERKFHEAEDLLSPELFTSRKLRRSFSDGQTKRDKPLSRTPPVAVGKENLGTHFKNSPLSKSDMSETDIKQVEESEDEKDHEQSLVKISYRNPITGEVVETTTRCKLGDATNIADQDKATLAEKNEEAEILEKKKTRRPCIRVREPPGGKSSIIF